MNYDEEDRETFTGAQNTVWPTRQNNAAEYVTRGLRIYRIQMTIERLEGDLTVDAHLSCC